MFQTKFDRWLIEKFVYEHHIFTMQPPQCLPKRFKSIKAPAGSKYPFLLKIRNKKHAEICLAKLTEAGTVYYTKIHERNGPLNWLIYNKKKSFSYRVFWWVVVIVGVGYLALKINNFMQTDTWEDIKESFLEVIESAK